MAQSDGRVRWVITGLALFALLRVSLTALSFPFFGHMDEVAHADTVLKYARGQLPEEGQEAFEDETIELFVLVNSGEFKQPLGEDPRLPAQFLTREQREVHLAKKFEEFRGTANHEAFETPPYYTLAAIWLHVARVFGAEGLDALWFVRTLGGVLLALAVVLSHVLLRSVVQDRPILWLGVPMLVAVYPQDALYFINNDVPLVLLMPLCLWLVHRLRARECGPGAHAVVGCVLALALIAKTTNVTILVVAGVMLLPIVRSRGFAFLVLGFVLPLVVWYGYAFFATGHVTVSSHKTELLGVTANTWEGIRAHPMWTLDGITMFFDQLLVNFWRGETQWHGEPMHHAFVDGLLIWTTIAFACTSLVASLRRRVDELPRYLALGAWIAIAAGFALMIAFSVGWEFGENAYPSREFPFLVSGRLQSGMFVLIALLYLDGLDRLTRPLGRFAPWVALGILLATLVASEIVLMAPVVTSPHNFWHLDV